MKNATHTTTLIKGTVAALLGLVAAGCVSAAPPSAGELGPVIPMRIGDAGSRGVSLAAAGSRLVMVWAAGDDKQTNVYAAVSADAGRSFAAPVRVNDIEGDARVNDEQPPRVAIGREIVVAWQSKRDGNPAILLARSKDEGRSFEPAQTVHDPHLTGPRGWSSIALDTTGGIHIAWLDTRDPSRKPSASTPEVPHVHGAGAMKQNIFHAVVRSDGTRAESLVATDVCFCCKTGVAIGPDGSTYVAWRNVYPTDLRDMAVARSTGDGSFTAPARVSEDGWKLNACPEDGPAIVVDASGVVHIAWPTIVGPASTQKGIFYSYSTDGGRTFARRIRLDDVPGGGFAAHPQISLSRGAVTVVWDERTADASRIRLRSISADPGGSTWHPHGGPVTVIAEAMVSHPAVAQTRDGLAVGWAQQSAAGTDVRIRNVSLR